MANYIIDKENNTRFKFEPNSGTKLIIGEFITFRPRTYLTFLNGKYEILNISSDAYNTYFFSKKIDSYNYWPNINKVEGRFMSGYVHREFGLYGSPFPLILQTEAPKKLPTIH